MGEGDVVADGASSGEQEHGTPYVHLGIRVGAEEKYVDPASLLPDRVTVPPPTGHIHLVKLVNGDDANSAPGPTVLVGSTVQFSYIVLNDGEGVVVEAEWQYRRLDDFAHALVAGFYDASCRPYR